jgi:hypothetical protein
MTKLESTFVPGHQGPAALGPGHRRECEWELERSPRDMMPPSKIPKSSATKPGGTCDRSQAVQVTGAVDGTV